jgi:hypothetical protein
MSSGGTVVRVDWGVGTNREMKYNLVCHGFVVLPIKIKVKNFLQEIVEYFSDKRFGRLEH